MKRLLRLAGDHPYITTLVVLWVLPALAVLLGYLLLPDHNTSGQCEGIGWGCTPAPSVGIVLLGFLAAPWLLGAGIVALVLIALIRAAMASERRHGRG